MWNILQNIALIVTSLLVGSISLIYLYYKYAFNHWKKLGVPYPEPSFPLGNMHTKFAKYIGQSIAEIYHDMKKAGVSYCGYYMFAMPVFMPIDPKLNKHLLTIDFNCFHDRGFYSDEIKDPMGASLITFSGEKWKKMREKLTPLFTAQKSKIMLPIVLKCTKDLENVLDKANKNKEPINIQDIAKRYTVDVICSCAFGVECNCLQDPNAEFIKHAKMIFTTSIRDNMRLALGQSAPFISKLFNIHLFNPTATKFFGNVVKETVAYREQNKIEIGDFINFLIRLKNNKSIEDDYVDNDKQKDSTEALTDNQIASQCFLFFIAGFETTSACLSYTMYELAANVHIQDRVRKEIIDVMKNESGQLSYEATKQMKYMDSVIHESLRKYPVVHMLNRYVTADFKIPDTDIIIKKGSRAVISTLGLHTDPEYFPDPEKFDPDRFTDEEKAKRPPFTFLPFGDGPRICPASRFGVLELKIAISSLLQKYKFTVHPSFKGPLKLCSIGNVLGTEECILLAAEKIK